MESDWYGREKVSFGTRHQLARLLTVDRNYNGKTCSVARRKGKTMKTAMEISGAVLVVLTFVILGVIQHG